MSAGDPFHAAPPHLRFPMPSPKHHGEDLELARAALAGEEPARGQLFARLRCVPRYVRAMNQRLGRPLDEGALEDLAQNSLLLLWNKLPEYQGLARLETWAFRFCSYETLNAMRRTRRQRARSGDTAQLHRVEEPGVHVPVDSGLIHEELEAMLAHLSPRESQVIELRHFEGLELGEVAQRLSISPSSVKTHYYRALEKLREWMSHSERELR